MLDHMRVQHFLSGWMGELAGSELVDSEELEIALVESYVEGLGFSLFFFKTLLPGARHLSKGSSWRPLIDVGVDGSDVLTGLLLLVKANGICLSSPDGVVVCLVEDEFFSSWLTERDLSRTRLSASSSSSAIMSVIRFNSMSCK